MSIRAEKVASAVKKALAEPISSLATEHSAGLATVTTARISNDLQNAKIYVSVYGGKITPGQFLLILEDEKSSLKNVLSSKVRMRFMPELKFFIDDTLDQMEHIQKLLDDVKPSENNPSD